MPNIKEKGSTGLSIFSGIVSEEFLRELRGREGYKRYDEMRRNEATIGGALYYHEQAIRKVSWNFANKASSRAKDERVDFLNYAREQMSQSWNDAVSEWLSFLWVGFHLSYPVYKYDKNNKVVWDAFSPRKQNTVYQWVLNYPGYPDYDEKRRNGDILAFVQQAPPSYEMTKIEMEKVIHFRTRVEANNPEGISLLRNAWVSYYFVKNLRSVEAIGFERDTAGMPIVKMPSGATNDPDDANSDYSKAAEMVRNVRVDEQGGVVLPFGWDFQLASSGGKSFADLGAAIGRYESRMLMSFMSQWIMLGQNNVGTQALSGDQTSISEMIVNTTADILAETFTKQEIPRILKLNGWSAEDIVLEHTPAGDTNISIFADFIQKISDKLTWDASDELWLRQLAGLPEKNEAELTLAQNEKETRSAAMREALLQRAKTQPPNGNKLADDMPMDKEPEAEEGDYIAELFGTGKPLDERTRARTEKAWNDAITLLFAKQKRRLMKAARELKGVS